MWLCIRQHGQLPYQVGSLNLKTLPDLIPWKAIGPEGMATMGPDLSPTIGRQEELQMYLKKESYLKNRQHYRQNLCPPKLMGWKL